LNKKQGSEFIQSFYLRKHYLLQFLSELNPNLTINIVELQEPCGPTKDQYFEGLIVTKETIKGGDFINNIRQENNLEKLRVFVTGLVNSEQDDKISSGDIRKGFLDRLDFEEKTVIPMILKGKSMISELWLDNLMCCYMEKWRFYHSLVHVYDMMKLFEEFRGEIKEEKRVYIAIWFHDAVYLPGSEENEEVFIDKKRFFKRLYRIV